MGPEDFEGHFLFVFLSPFYYLSLTLPGVLFMPFFCCTFCSPAEIKRKEKRTFYLSLLRAFFFPSRNECGFLVQPKTSQRKHDHVPVVTKAATHAEEQGRACKRSLDNGDVRCEKTPALAAEGHTCLTGPRHHGDTFQKSPSGIHHSRPPFRAGARKGFGDELKKNPPITPWKAGGRCVQALLYYLQSLEETTTYKTAGYAGY